MTTKKTPHRRTVSDIPGSRIAVETAIDLSKSERQGTWETVPRKTEGSIKPWESNLQLAQAKGAADE